MSRGPAPCTTYNAIRVPAPPSLSTWPPTTNPVEFGSYPNYLAARVDGLGEARELSRTETIGRFAKTEEVEDGGEGSVAID